jgi:NADH-quinone oxidoreductase subunit J
MDEMRAGFWKHLPLAGLVGALIALEMAAVLLGGFKVSVAKEMPPEVLAMGNSKALGVEIYTQYLYPLQVAAVILLVAIIAAIALTLQGAQGQQVPATRPGRCS